MESLIALKTYFEPASTINRIIKKGESFSINKIRADLLVKHGFAEIENKGFSKIEFEKLVKPNKLEELEPILDGVKVEKVKGQKEEKTEKE